MIEWIILIASAIHSLIFFSLYFVFRRVESPVNTRKKWTFSVLIPVRNESVKIADLLEDLNGMDYPRDLFEVIVIDDNSEDNTTDIIGNFPANYKLRLLKLEGDKKGKKPALEMGVRHAENELILTTDGDCRVQNSWIQCFNQAFDKDTKLMVGPVQMTHKNLFGLLQSIDFTILIGYAASLVGLKKPSMSNGANMAYQREVFFNVQGYKGNDQVPTGDDEFLLLKVAKKYGDAISFVKAKGAVVSTDAKPTFRELLNQRKRWLSKWTIHKSWSIVFSVLLVLLDNIIVLIGMVGMIIGVLPFWLVSLLFVRILAKIQFSHEINKMLGQSTISAGFVFYELIYPFYVLLLSFASIFGDYTWKGRRYR